MIYILSGSLVISWIFLVVVTGLIVLNLTENEPRDIQDEEN